MRHFFVTGLPRSRTAWLANFLTNGDSMCIHGGLLECGGDPEALAAVLKTRTYAHVGDSDASLLARGNLEVMMERFPDADWVFIVQEPAESHRRHNLAFPEMPRPIDMFQFLYERLFFAIGTIPAHRALVFQEKDLDDGSICDAIHRRCLDRGMDVERWTMLRKMKIVADKARWLQSMRPEVRARVEAACAR